MTGKLWESSVPQSQKDEGHCINIFSALYNSSIATKITHHLHQRAGMQIIPLIICIMFFYFICWYWEGLWFQSKWRQGIKQAEQKALQAMQYTVWVLEFVNGRYFLKCLFCVQKQSITIIHAFPDMHSCICAFRLELTDQSQDPSCQSNLYLGASSVDHSTSQVHQEFPWTYFDMVIKYCQNASYLVSVAVNQSESSVTWIVLLTLCLP